MARSYLERSDLVPQLAEIFRRYGYEGASIGVIAQETGAGRSSLYHFFPGGKEEMADAVLAQISDWFEVHIFAPLRERPAPQALAEMAAAVETYFRSGQRICLVGAFALDDVRSRFSGRIESYFARWGAALAECLQRGGVARTRGPAGSHQHSGGDSGRHRPDPRFGQCRGVPECSCNGAGAGRAGRNRRNRGMNRGLRGDPAERSSPMSGAGLAGADQRVRRSRARRRMSAWLLAPVFW